ncbi:MAG: hypothetical protein IAG10_13860 [Planctomycetaceae bacterium]|nr:hypothetical protein [Planctomycetaceae bacterium]
MAGLLPRKRTVIGGTLALGLVAGIWLSGKLPHMGSGFGLGSGGDGMLGQPDTSNVSVQTDDGAAKSDSLSAPVEHGPKPNRTDAEPLDDVLTILVEDRHYAVWKKTRKGNGYFPAEMDELIQLALAAKSNEDGLRVRVLRSESARVTAWQKLQSELVQAGVPADAIVLTKDLVK